MAPEFEEFLNSDLKYYRDIIVTGCCTDLCVLHFVLSLNTWLNEHNMNEYRIVVVDGYVSWFSKFSPGVRVVFQDSEVS